MKTNTTKRAAVGDDVVLTADYQALLGEDPTVYTVVDARFAGAEGQLSLIPAGHSVWTSERKLVFASDVRVCR